MSLNASLRVSSYSTAVVVKRADGTWPPRPNAYMVIWHGVAPGPPDRREPDVWIDKTPT